MAKEHTALTRVKDELSRLQEAIRQYEQHKTPAGLKAASESRQMGRPVHYHDSGNCPERAAVKRASMDAWRALAALRREAGLW